MWTWLRDVADPLQALVAVIGLAVAVIGLVVSVVGVVVTVVLAPSPGPGDPSNGPEPTGARPPPTVTLEDRSAVLVSGTATSERGDGGSGRPSVSADARYIAFTSAAANLGPGRQVTQQYNIYRKDLATGEIQLISQTPDGSYPNGQSQFPSICRNGRFVAFSSDATNLLVGGPALATAKWRVYVRDTLSGRTYLASITPTGDDEDGESRAPVLSAECASVAFESTSSNLVPRDDNGATDVFIRTFADRHISLVSTDASGLIGDGPSLDPDIDPRGTLVSFTSAATNLPGATPGRPGVFVKNTTTGAITSASAPFVAMDSHIAGFAWPNFSPDGHYLVFRSLDASDDLTARGRDVLVWDVWDGDSAIAGPDGQPTGWRDACTSGTSNGTRFAPGMSGTGGEAPYWVVFTVALPDGGCHLVLRDLQGRDVPVELAADSGDIIEPAVDAAGTMITWVDGPSPTQVYACYLKDDGRPRPEHPVCLHS